MILVNSSPDAALAGPRLREIDGVVAVEADHATGTIKVATREGAGARAKLASTLRDTGYPEKN